LPQREHTKKGKKKKRSRRVREVTRLQPLLVENPNGEESERKEEKIIATGRRRPRRRVGPMAVGKISQKQCSHAERGKKRIGRLLGEITGKGKERRASHRRLIFVSCGGFRRKKSRVKKDVTPRGRAEGASNRKKIEAGGREGVEKSPDKNIIMKGQWNNEGFIGNSNRVRDPVIKRTSQENEGGAAF